MDVALELRERPITPQRIDLRDWRPSASAEVRHIAIVGLGAIAGVVLIGLALVGGGALAQSRTGGLFSSGQSQMRSGSLIPRQSLDLQVQLVERPRAALAAYSADLARFKAATTRAPGSAGINLGASEVRRREEVMAGLVLECIDAVDRYNLAAAALSETQLQSAGLPVRFVWATDCAPAQ